MTKITQAEYIDALDAKDAVDAYDNHKNDTDANIENPDQSEAQQLASVADTPRLRVLKARQLTQKQMAFIAAKISGLSNSAAYREAYPADTSNDRVIAANAYRMTKHKAIAPVLEKAMEETLENLTEDIAATKRYVLRSLLTMSKHSKQEGSRLKALELMGKAVGAFTHITETVATPQTAEQLRRDLAGHLKLLKKE